MSVVEFETADAAVSTRVEDVEQIIRKSQADRVTAAGTDFIGQAQSGLGDFRDGYLIAARVDREHPFAILADDDRILGSQRIGGTVIPMPEPSPPVAKVPL